MELQDTPVFRVSKNASVDDVREYEDHHLCNAFKHDLSRGYAVQHWFLSHLVDLDPRYVSRVKHLIHICDGRVVSKMARELRRRHFTLDKEICDPWSYIRKLDWQNRVAFLISADVAYDDILFPTGIASRDPVVTLTMSEKQAR